MAKENGYQLSSTAPKLFDLLSSRYPLLWVVTHEESRVDKDLRHYVSKKESRNLYFWKLTAKLTDANGSTVKDTDCSTADEAIQWLLGQEQNAILSIRDAHHFLQDPEFLRWLRDAELELKKAVFDRVIVITSPVSDLPPDLEKAVTVLDYALPTRQELEAAAERVIQMTKKKKKGWQPATEARALADAATGLSEGEFKNALMLARTRHKNYDVATILEEKKHVVRKGGILEFCEFEATMDGVGGLATLKEWLKIRYRAFVEKEARKYGLKPPKGILLVGVPGCGKSLAVKAVASLWKMPLLRLDVGKVFSSLVGSSEENIRSALRLAEAIAPCILMLDEMEKGLAGTRSSGELDSGVGARVFGYLLSWMQDHEAPVFMAATANAVEQLPPELLRKGRFDEVDKGLLVE
jgi:hypothetical protein